MSDNKIGRMEIVTGAQGEPIIRLRSSEEVDYVAQLKAKLVDAGFDVEKLEVQLTEFKSNNPEIIERIRNGSKDAEAVVERLVLAAIEQRKREKAEVDDLPASLTDVVGDFDITEELKRRLEAKKHLSIDENCECKSLSDAEIAAAMRTAHDIKTGKINPEDLKSPITIHPKLIEAAVCAPSTGDAPSTYRDWRGQYGKWQEKVREQLEEDIKLSKKVVESLVEEKIIDDFQSDQAKRILTSALQRERDKEVVFVPVTGMDPREAAQRVINLKSEYDEVEPVDLSGVLDDVNPICDLHIEKLQPIMNVKKAIDFDEVPDEIRFVIPTVDLPAIATTDPEDIKFGMTRYVHFDSMPKELQRVIRTYLSLKSGTDFGVKFAQRNFKEAVAELAKRAEATFEDDDLVELTDIKPEEFGLSGKFFVKKEK